MEYQRFVTRAFTISQSQDEWLIEQANKRLLSKSAIVREALLQFVDTENGDKKKAQSK